MRLITACPVHEERLWLGLYIAPLFHISMKNKDFQTEPMDHCMSLAKMWLPLRRCCCSRWQIIILIQFFVNWGMWMAFFYLALEGCIRSWSVAWRAQSSLPVGVAEGGHPLLWLFSVYGAALRKAFCAVSHAVVTRGIFKMHLKWLVRKVPLKAHRHLE